MHATSASREETKNTPQLGLRCTAQKGGCRMLLGCARKAWWKDACCVPFSACLVLVFSVLSGQLLIYFVSSFSRPQPWQVTVSDMELCNRFHGDRLQCNAAGHSVLCSYVPDTNVCIASPTGKVRAAGQCSYQCEAGRFSLDMDPSMRRTGSVIRSFLSVHICWVLAVPLGHRAGLLFTLCPSCC